MTAVPSRCALPNSCVNRKAPTRLHGLHNNSDLCETLGICRIVEIDTTDTSDWIRNVEKYVCHKLHPDNSSWIAQTLLKFKRQIAS